ncbi:hypothetical protein [Halostella litorea]|nr:hypothetical protein [Halostella litorea]
MTDWKYTIGDEIEDVGTVTGTAHNLFDAYYHIDDDHYVRKTWVEARGSE